MAITIVKDKELSNCGLVKTTMMLLVLLYHSMIFWTGAWTFEAPDRSSNMIALLAEWLNTFHIYTFTFVSGYIFAYKRYEVRSYDNFRRFVFSKVKRLLLPAVVVSLLWVIPLTTFYYRYGINEIVKRYLLATAPNQLWFLWMLFWVFVFAWFLSNIFVKNNKASLIIAISMYMIGVFGSMVFPNIYQIWTAFQYLFFFLLGLKCRQYHGKWTKKVPIIVWVILDVSIFAMLRVIPDNGSLNRLIVPGLSFLCNFIGVYMAFYVLQWIADKERWRNSKIYMFFQDKSMGIYLFHQQIIYVSLHCFNGVLSPIAHVIVNMVISVSLSSVIVCVLKKNRYLRFIIGE